MKMKCHYMTVMILGLVVCGCSDRMEAIERLNAHPDLFLVDSANALHMELIDSIRYSEDPPTFYNVKLRMADLDQNLWRCRVEADSGRVTTIYKGEEMVLPSVRVDQEFVELSVSPKQIGNNTIKFVLEDRFAAKAEAILNLYVFANLRPVAALQYARISGYEYEFSGVASYDADQRFGGKVVAYEFTIAGLTFTTPSATARHVFSGPGTYTVRLRVMDNNGEFSPYDELRLVITGND